MLVDRRILARIVEAAHIGKSDIVLEAGTGQGILTEELCKSARRVVSYEVDKKLYQQALKHLQFQNLELVNADLFKTTDLRCDVFISNLPYSRSRDAFEWLAAKKFGEAVVMVQKEFADKLTARPADKNYRAISALAAHCFSIEKIVRVGRRSFEPQPKVESVVIKIIPVNTVRKEAVKALNLLFSKRNKIASTVASNSGVRADFGSKRIDQLAPADLIRLAELISNVRSI
jgi:16S rRNA (adenine1518-N6/adenine1519-N6)-dimethyltransferase